MCGAALAVGLRPGCEASANAACAFPPPPLGLQVEYSYSSLGLVQKPLLLLAALGALIAAVVALNRLGGASKAAGKLKDS